MQNTKGEDTFVTFNSLFTINFKSKRQVLNSFPCIICLDIMYSMVQFFTVEETIGQRKIQKDGSTKGNGLKKKTFDRSKNIKTVLIY